MVVKGKPVVGWIGVIALRRMCQANGGTSKTNRKGFVLIKCRVRKLVAMLIATSLATGCATYGTSSKPWTKYVKTNGQPEPVPTQWVESAEGAFAHSIELPQPLPKDSGYRRGMTSEQYFAHLCKSEAGDFIYRRIEAVDGFYFVRPPRRPTDEDLQDRYKLEAPEIERTYQLMESTPAARATTFVSPPFRVFQFVEEPNPVPTTDKPYVRAFGYLPGKLRTQVEPVSELRSVYGLIWRGVKRPHDRELFIAGSEWIVFDLKTNQVLAVRRDYARTGFNRNTAEGIWWLNAQGCPNVLPRDNLSSRFYQFVVKALSPDVSPAK